MPKRTRFRVGRPVSIAAVIVATAAGCSARVAYDSAQNWQRLECQKIQDLSARNKCLAEASIVRGLQATVRVGQDREVVSPARAPVAKRGSWNDCFLPVGDLPCRQILTESSRWKTSNAVWYAQPGSMGLI
jgi:hypothetical protein